MISAQRLDEGFAADVGLEAAAVAAATQWAVLVDRQMTEFARAAIVSVEHLAVDDQPGTDAVVDAQIDGGFLAPQGSRPEFGSGAQVRVVVDEDRAVQSALEHLGD